MARATSERAAVRNVMRILHIVPSIQRSTGGPAVSVTRLASEQARLGHEVTVASLKYPGLGAMVEAPGVRMATVSGGVAAVRGRGWSLKFRRVVREEAERADVVHNHGLWMWPGAYAREGAVAAGRPLVISPRGMLEPWSLRRSRLRKAVAWRLFEEKNLRSAALFHATAESEAVSIRRKCVRGGARIAVVANGVDLPDLAHRPTPQGLEEKFPQLAGRRRVVFMSRLHPKKGIDVLLQAWRSRMEVTANHFVLVLAGPDLTGYRREVERMLDGMLDSVVLTGEVQGETKEALLANADVFVLPSHSENFGLVVAEALAWGRPVIATTGAPWAEVREAGAGWWVNPDAESLGAALDEAMAMSDGERDAMGARGRQLVEERYGWEAAAMAMMREYGGIVGGNSFA